MVDEFLEDAVVKVGIQASRFGGSWCSCRERVRRLSQTPPAASGVAWSAAALALPQVHMQAPPQR
jgi:hypothetical protein